MVCRPLVLAALLSGMLAVPVAGQHRPAAFERWEVTASSFTEGTAWDRDSTEGAASPRGDYRYEGLALGGLSFGVAGVLVGRGLAVGCPTVPGADCEPDRLGNAITLGLVGAAVGGGLGYLIGRLSPKRSPEPH
jgi:hypothetical protein